MDMPAELARLTGELADRYPMYPHSAIEGLVRRTHLSFRDAPIQTYVPVLVRRAAEAQLRYMCEADADADAQPITAELKTG